MAAQKQHRSITRKHRKQRLRLALIGGASLASLLVVFWQTIWLYLVGGFALAGVTAGGWWLWRADRLIKGRSSKSSLRTCADGMDAPKPNGLVAP